MIRNRVSDPVLSHDPFSSLMWALFCLPFPFLTCEDSLLSLVHIFHSVSLVQVCHIVLYVYTNFASLDSQFLILLSLVQTVIAYCACRLSDLSELNFEENLLNDILNALRKSGGWEYFRSNNMDLSCDIKDTIRIYSLPFLRRCALLWKLLKSTPGKFHEEADMFDLTSDFTSDNMDFMYSPQSELNHVQELEKMFKIPPIDTILNNELLRSSTQTWLQHFQHEYRVNRVERPLCITPAVPFQLMKLPNLYQDLLQRFAGTSLSGFCTSCFPFEDNFSNQEACFIL